jgi:hypothetical protein
MKVAQLINILALMDPEADVHLKIIGLWEGTEKSLTLVNIEFTGEDVRCDDSVDKVVTIYSDLKEIKHK